MLLRSAYIGILSGVVLLAAVVGCGIGRPTGVARGQALFKTCVPCHGENGGGNLELRTPAIAGLPDWYLRTELRKFGSDIRGAHPDDMEGHRMRPMARSLYQPGDVEAVAAYVSGMNRAVVKPVLSGDRADGQAKFNSVCVACHGPDGRGTMGLGAPPLTQQADWYLVAQLKKFKSGMRGANLRDTTGIQMRAMSLTLQDTTAMRNVVAYIKSLPN